MDQTNETRLGSAPLGKLLFQLGLPAWRLRSSMCSIIL